MGDLKETFRNYVRVIKFLGRTDDGKPLRTEDIAKKLGYTREYLTTLMGKNGKVQQAHIDLLKDTFPNVTVDVTKSNVEGIYKVEPRPIRQPKTETNPETEGITFIPISAQAGYYRKIVDPMFKSSLQKIFIPGMPYRGENYRIWEVEGNSMEPTFKEHFYLLTERVEQQFWKQAKNFHAYVIVTEDDVLLKRVYRKDATTWVLISDNEELYPQFPLEVSEIKELWFVRRKMDWEMSPPKRFEIKI